MRLAVQKLFGGKVRDVMTGYRALSYRFAKTIPVLSQNFEIETELTVKIKHNKRWHKHNKKITASVLFL